MLPQLTVYAKILYLLMVVSSAYSELENVVLTSHCSDRSIRIDQDGNVSTVHERHLIDVLEVNNTPWIVSEATRQKLYIKSKATQMYLCFNPHWRLVGMKASSEKKLPKRCFFYEGPGELNTHTYYSIINQRKRLGFNRKGNPIGPNMRAKENCFLFNKLPALVFFDTFELDQRNYNITVDDNQRIDNLHNTVNHRNHKLIDGSPNSHQAEHSIQHHSVRHHHDDVQNVLKRRNHQQQHRHSNHETHPQVTNHQLQEVEPNTAIGNGQGSRRPGGIGPQRKGRKKRIRKKPGLPKQNENQNPNRQQQQENIENRQRHRTLNARSPHDRRVVLQRDSLLKKQPLTADSIRNRVFDNSNTDRINASDAGPTMQGLDGGVSFQNIQDEYSNDDASAINVLPNTLDSSTEYLYSNNRKYLSSSSSFSNNYNINRNTNSYNGKINNMNNDDTKNDDNFMLRKQLTNNNNLRLIAVNSRSNSDSSTSSSSSSRNLSNNKNNSNINDNLMFNSQTRKYYKKSAPALIPASVQSTVVGDQFDPSGVRNLNVNDKITATNLVKMRTNHKSTHKSLLRRNFQ